MIPTRMQWKNWTLPSKASYIGLAFGVLGVFLTLIFRIFPDDNTDANGFASFNVENAPWVRVTNISGMIFRSILSTDGLIRTIIPGGIVHGTVSNPKLSVFLLAKVAKRNDEMKEPTDEQFWRVSEAVVDASGNWYANVCGYRYLRSSQRPFFEYWEVMAVSVNEYQELLSNVPNPTCSISSAKLLGIESIICSETKVIMRPPDDGVGAYLGDVRPSFRNPCLEGESA